MQCSLFNSNNSNPHTTQSIKQKEKKVNKSTHHLNILIPTPTPPLLLPLPLPLTLHPPINNQRANRPRSMHHDRRPRTATFFSIPLVLRLQFLPLLLQRSTIMRRRSIPSRPVQRALAFLDIGAGPGGGVVTAALLFELLVGGRLGDDVGEELEVVDAGDCRCEVFVLDAFAGFALGFDDVVGLCGEVLDELFLTLLLVSIYIYFFFFECRFLFVCR